MKKILIIGSSGLLGINFISKLRDKYNLICNQHKQKLNIHSNIVKINLFNKKNIESVILSTKPNIILNCSGLTDLKKCEKNKKLAYNLNFLITKNLCDVIKNLNIRLVHISTDHLFDGKKLGFYRENDKKNPLNTYSLTKSKSEEEIKKKLKNFLIIRTNFFGWGTNYRSSITDYIIQNLIQNKKVFLSKEIIFTPIYIGSLIDLIDYLISKNKRGIYNLSTNNQISKFDFGLKIAKHFNLNDKLIKASEDKTVLKPKNMALLNNKIKKFIPSNFFSLEKNIKKFKNDFEKSHIKQFYKFHPYGKHHLFRSDIKEVNKVLFSNNLTQGPKIDEFEKKIANFVGSKYAVAVSSCSAGLHLACKVAGLNKSNKFITSPNTFVSTANAGLHCGSKVIFSDISLKTGNLDFEILKNLLKKEKNVKAIIPVHFSGMPFNTKILKNYLRKKKIFIIEDAAHALGSKYNDGSMVGCCKYSDMTVFSFHPVKSIACGEGGIITTNDYDIYLNLKKLRSHGIEKAPLNNYNKTKKRNNLYSTWYYEMQELGYHYRLTDIQASLGISQLKNIDKFINKRRLLAENYDKKLSKINNISILNYNNRKISSNHIYVILIDFKKINLSRTNFMKNLLYLGIGSQLHYIPVFLHPFYKRLNKIHTKNFVNTTHYFNSALSIPLYYGLKISEQNKIIKSLIKVLN
mgnify:CR=1 FL=1